MVRKLKRPSASALKDGTQFHCVGIPIRTLDVVEPFRVRMPDVDPRVGDRLAVYPGDLRLDEARITLDADRDVGAVCRRLRPLDMERAEHRLFCRLLHALVALRDHKLREAECVREQDELLPRVGALVARACEELDPLEPLVLGEIDLASELMEMLHERSHDLLQPRIRDVGEPLEDGLGDVALIEVA